MTITNMWTAAPAGFLRLGGCDVRPVADGLAVRGIDAVRGVAPVFVVEGTGVSHGSAQAPGTPAIDGQKFITLAHTYGTTLGIPSSRRPLS